MLREQSEVIAWDPEGGIVIEDRQRLEATLSVYFRHNRFTSFQRQLNNFGFHKKRRGAFSTPGGGRKGAAYGHQLLRSEAPEAVLRLRRDARPRTDDRNWGGLFPEPNRYEEDSASSENSIKGGGFAGEDYDTPKKSAVVVSTDGSLSENLEHKAPLPPPPPKKNNALASLADVAISALTRLGDDDSDQDSDDDLSSDADSKKVRGVVTPEKDDPRYPQNREKILALARAIPDPNGGGGFHNNNNSPSKKKKKLTSLSLSKRQQQQNRPQRRARPFPCVLRDMIENSPDEVVRWSDDGCVFVVSDTETLCLEILPKYFRHCRLASFQRQLSLYQFRRARVSKTASYNSKSTPLAYCHALFERGCDEQQLRAITRTAPKHTSSLAQVSHKMIFGQSAGQIRSAIADGDNRVLYSNQQVPFVMPPQYLIQPLVSKSEDTPDINKEEEEDDEADLREAVYAASRRINLLRAKSQENNTAENYAQKNPENVASVLFELRSGGNGTRKQEDEPEEEQTTAKRPRLEDNNSQEGTFE